MKLLCENHEIEEFLVCSLSLPCDHPTSIFKDLFDHFSRLTLFQNRRKLQKIGQKSDSFLMIFE